MRGRAYGAENVLGALIELADGASFVRWPLAGLRLKTNLSDPTLKKYLESLEAEGHIETIWGGHGGRQIEKIKLGKKALLFGSQRFPAEPVIGLKANTGLNGNGSNGSHYDGSVVALVDFDNVTGSARDASFSISFGRIREYVRRFGTVLFVDAFVSPNSARPEIVQGLWNAGFQVIACPMASKDRDDVDAKMNWRARQYLNMANVTTVIIVSRDQDFRDLTDYAEDLHKKVVFIDVVKQRSEFEGVDPSGGIPTYTSRRLIKFTRALDQLSENSRGYNAEEAETIRFVRDVVVECDAREKDMEKLALAKPSFLTLQSYVSARVMLRWSKIFTAIDVKQALTAMVEARAVEKLVGGGTTYYVLSRNHPAVKNVLDIEVKEVKV